MITLGLIYLIIGLLVILFTPQKRIYDITLIESTVAKNLISVLLGFVSASVIDQMFLAYYSFWFFVVLTHIVVTIKCLTENVKLN